MTDKKRSFFDEDVGKSFIEAVQQTFGGYFSEPVNLVAPRLFENSEVVYDIGGLMKFDSHEVEGSMIVAFEKDFLLKVYEHMLGENPGAITSDVEDAVGELTNIVYGVAKAHLVNKGYQFPMSRPQISRDINQFLVQNAKCLELPFRLQIGKDKQLALLLVVNRLKQDRVAG
ncbi:MAG: chemotaxis protein CheX [Bdellovibrionaceae bacterium]|nr:chemotaxis protein CheX [Pseudobdellovibrionaceae bacterium]